MTIGPLGCSLDKLPSVDAAPIVEPEPELASEPPVPPAADPALPRADSLELTFVGDVVLGRYRSDQRFAAIDEPERDPFFAVREQLAADVVVGNLESPVMFTLPERSPSRHKHRFAASAAQLGQLVDAGFTVMSLANNHYFDLGVAGQLESPRALSEAGLLAIGASRTEPPLVRVESFEARGWRLGFIAFATRQNSAGVPGGPALPLLSLGQIDELIVPLVHAARDDHDLLIVAVHWGDEYVDDPGKSRRLAARRLLEAGVDLVIGHHPHVLQAIERRRSGDDRDGLIAYSLGNFLFPRGDHPAGLSGVLRVRYRHVADGRPCLEQARLHPVITARKPRWHPEAATGLAAEKVRRRVVPLSLSTKTRWVREGEPGDPARGEDLLVTGLRKCPA
ncbi:MAG: CapA family protein [Enhygromyxa sp.]